MRTACFVALLALTSCSAAKPTFDDGGGSDGGSDGGPDGGPDAFVPCEREGYRECDPADEVECETYTWADEASCGTCGRACTDGELCIAGACEPPLIRTVSLGAGHTCVLTTAGRVLCWGRNTRGQLGDGTYSEIDDLNRPDAVAVLEIDDGVDLEADGYSACAIRGESRVVECWGDNSPNRFGPEIDTQSLYVRPEPLSGASPVEEVSLTSSHVCARTTTGVLCAGRDASGALGRTDTTLVTTLAPVEGLPAGAPRDVATGGPGAYGHTCVAVFDGRVFCFGSNGELQCGQETVSDIDLPLEVAGLSDVVQLEAGNAFTCARTRAGEVYCWGGNGSGQLGNGAIGGASAVPTQVMGSLPAIGHISAGGEYVLAVSEDGDQVWGWGAGGYGQLGRGADLSDVATPTLLLGGSAVTYEAFAGGVHACVLERRSGMPERLLCTGNNSHGELGRSGPSMGTTFEPTEALP